MLTKMKLIGYASVAALALTSGQQSCHSGMRYWLGAAV